MIESVEALCALRGTIARIEGQRTADAPAPAPLGHATLDAAIGGGLARGRLHELFAAQPEDAGAAAGFATMLALLALPPGAPLLWLRQDEAERGLGRLHPPGLAEIGLDPSRTRQSSCGYFWKRTSPGSSSRSRNRVPNRTPWPALRA